MENQSQGQKIQCGKSHRAHRAHIGFQISRCQSGNPSQGRNVRGVSTYGQMRCKVD